MSFSFRIRFESRELLQAEHALAYARDRQAQSDLSLARRRLHEWPCGESEEAFESAEQWAALQRARLHRAEREMRRRRLDVPVLEPR